MSNFLSNIISRHSQKANFVHPRGVGVFESHRSWSEAFPSTAESNSGDSQTYASSSIDSVINPAVHQKSSIESTGNSSSIKYINPIKREKQQPIGQLDNNKQHSKERIIDKLNFKSKMQATKIADLKNGDGNFKNMTSSEDIIDSLQNRIAVIKANNKFSGSPTGSVDKHMDTDLQVEQMLMKPRIDIKQQLMSKFNLKSSSPSESGSHNKSDNINPVGNSTPTVKIHIGRIDIKAVKQNTQTVQNNRKASKQGMSLEQFLNKRSAKE